MSSLTLQPLDPAGLRLTPGFSAVPTEALPAAMAKSHGSRLEGRGAFGLLVSPHPEDPPIPVGRITASALNVLQEAGPSPLGSSVLEEPEAQRQLGRLVLHGVVEVAGPSGFVSGPSAYHLVVRENPGRDPKSVSAHLSLRALRFAQALGISDAWELSRRLYYFNALPASPRRVRRLECRPAFRNLWEPDSLKGSRADGWVREESRRGDQRWIVWRVASLAKPPPRAAVSFKLYISPSPEDLPGVVAASLPILADTGALAVKAASVAAQALRPDKMVAYFSSGEDLRRAGHEMVPALSGFRAHGVPFSAALDDTGLLSWGIDPPESSGPESEPGRSWRGRITRELAQAMVVPAVDHEDPEPWEFALACLSLLGIDDEAFSPPSHGWDSPLI